MFLKSKYLECKKEIELQKNRIGKIRNTVNSLTNEVVNHLNKINRILTEVETTYNHPDIEENCT
jgi:hypothetical protein